MPTHFSPAENILANNIDGFHRYCFATPIHPDYVSNNLCSMLDCTEQELLNPNTDGYAALVHPEDREKYAFFLKSLSKKEQHAVLQYRLICKNGSVLYVRDSMVSHMNENGVMEGYSTLADITDLKKENEELHSLNGIVPCGILKYSCSGTSQITYANDQMLRLLHVPRQYHSDSNYYEQSNQSIYMLIAPEERNRFHNFLQLVYAQEKPIAGEITVVCMDGTRVRLYGWINKSINEDGEEEFQTVCMDVTDRYERKLKIEEQHYLHALSQVYDEVVKFDLAKKTIRFLHGHYRNRLGNMADMTCMIEDALSNWIENSVLEADRERVRAAFADLFYNQTHNPDAKPAQLEFSTRFSDQSVRRYMGIFLRISDSTCFFCCQNITQQSIPQPPLLPADNAMTVVSNEPVQEVAMQFTDGMLAFEIHEKSIRPLYFSENISSFFGYSKDEWMIIMQTMTPFQNFVSRCHISYEVFLELLEGRDAEFSHIDIQTRVLHRYKAIRTGDGRCDENGFYIMLYDMTDKEPAQEPLATVEPVNPRVYIRTFGYFDVFVDGTPIAFRNEKAKELFALLVDRRGGFITSSEAISYLWEDEPANAVTLARYRKVALRLKNTLEEYGISDIVESVDGKRRIVAQMAQCDLYDYLSGETQLFKGSYLQNYSWSEHTLSELIDWSSN